MSASYRAFRSLRHRVLPTMRSRLAYWNEDEMSWPMFFDMEGPLKSKSHELTVHWHRYALWRGQEVGTHRSVAGIVSEMAAHLYLSALLLEGNVTTFAQRDTPAIDDQLLASTDGEPGRTLEVCNECPLKSCCPWRAPTVRPEHSLSRKKGKFAPATTWLTLDKLELTSCGRNSFRNF